MYNKLGQTSLTKELFALLHISLLAQVVREKSVIDSKTT